MWDGARTGQDWRGYRTDSKHGRVNTKGVLSLNQNRVLHICSVF